MNGPSTSARDIRKSSFAFPRVFLGITFATALALSPVPAFAQHGGGGGGHSGGGGGGHAGGGGGGHASGGGTSTGSRGGTSTGATSTGHGGGTSSGNSAAGSNAFVAGGARNPTSSRSASSRFVGGNNTWQVPPNAAGGRISPMPARNFISVDDAAASGARVVHAPTEPKGMRGPFSPSTAMRGTFAGSVVSGLPPHIGPFPPHRFQPIFFLGGGCFNGFFPGFCGGGFFGGGFWGFGYGWGCDPFWGCPGWFNGGYNSGYYNGGSFGGEIYSESTDDSSVSREFNASRYANPPEGGASEGGSSASGSDYAAVAPETALYLKDGTVYALSDYWVADGKLHYVTNYGGENTIDLDQIDIQRTVDVNAKRGISVTLRPAPASQVQPQ